MQETRALILESLMVIDDPRVDRTKRHSLELILFVAVCSFLCGCENFNEMEEFARANEDWLRNAAKNLGALRKISLNLLRSNKAKGSIRIKRLRAALTRSFLADLLASL